MPRGGRARPRARGRLLAFVLCCAFLTAGCTHRSSRSGEPGGASAAPRVGGTLRIALVTPGSLDPAQATSAERRLLVGNLFDSLTTLDAAGTVRPAAAASWSSDQTMRHWRFQLRAGATYADGRAVRAGDFKAAWERLASPRTRPRPASPAALLGIVDGYQAVATGHARTISGIAAPDPATLQVDLSEAFADFPDLVADPRAVAGASADGRRRPGLLQGPELGSWSLGFDLDGQQGSDPRWRRAVSLALDRSRIAAAFQGAAAPAVGLVPTGVPGARQVACPTSSAQAPASLSSWPSPPHPSTARPPGSSRPSSPRSGSRSPSSRSPPQAFSANRAGQAPSSSPSAGPATFLAWTPSSPPTRPGSRTRASSGSSPRAGPPPTRRPARGCTSRPSRPPLRPCPSPPCSTTGTAPCSPPGSRASTSPPGGPSTSVPAASQTGSSSPAWPSATIPQRPAMAPTSEWRNRQTR